MNRQLIQRMCLKYISFNNSFVVTDSSDNNFFKMEELNGGRLGTLC